MAGDGPNHGVIRLVGLDDDAPRVLAAARAAGHLLEQVVGALPRPKVGHLEGVVGVHHAHERDLGKVQSLGDHLRAQQHGALRGVELLEQLLVPVLALGGVRVHANHPHVRGQQLHQRVLHLLSAEAHLGEIAAAALGARGAGVGVAAHVVDGPAGMALERARALVVGERRGAVPARGHAPALAAHEERREPAAVVQKHRLLAALGNRE